MDRRIKGVANAPRICVFEWIGTVVDAQCIKLGLEWNVRVAPVYLVNCVQCKKKIQKKKVQHTTINKKHH